MLLFSSPRLTVYFAQITASFLFIFLCGLTQPLQAGNSCGTPAEVTEWLWPFTAPEAEMPSSLTPFVCDGFYITHTSGTGFFSTYQIDGSAIDFGSVGNGVNATGYNSVDNFLYTIRSSDENVLRLRSDGTFDDLGTAGLPNNLVTGAFDDSGNYYIKTGNDFEVFRLDINTMTFTTQTPANLFFAKDWAYDIVRQKFYGVHAQDLYSFDPASNQVTIEPLTGVMAVEGNVYGAAFYSADGFIYVAANQTGNIYRINVDLLEAHFVLAATNFTGNDGASCSATLPPFPVICAHHDEVCVPVTGSVTFPILDNDLAHLTTIDVPSFSILSGPTAGTAAYNPGTGELTYTYSGAPQIDELTYQICGNSNNPVICDYATITFEPGDPVTFAPIGPFCQSSSPPNLPNQSQEGVAGTWSPTSINTSTVGSTTYTFTPAPSVDCTSPVDIMIQIDPTTNSSFSIPTSYCSGENVPILPGTDNNGIIGSWSPSMIDNQNAGTYLFTPDDGQCATTFTQNIDILDGLTVLLSIDNPISCAGENDGSLTTVVDGAGGYTYTWSDATLNGQSAPGSLTADTYELTVTDANGCSTTTAITLTDPTPLSLDCSNTFSPDAPGSLTGGARLMIQGGSADYTVNWSGPQSGNLARVAPGEQLIDNLGVGTYNVTITDANGCATSCSFTLTENNCSLTTIATGEWTDCAGNVGNIVIDTITGGNGFYEYSLDGLTYAMVDTFPFRIPVFSNSNNTLFVQDGNVCISNQEITFPLVGELQLALGDDQVVRLGDSMLLSPQTNFVPVSWVWTNPVYLGQPDSFSTCVAPLDNTILILEATDANGCIARDEIRINVDKREATFVPNAFSPNGDGVNDRLTIFAGNSIEVINSFQVFDRWGEQVFQVSDMFPNDTRSGWDGGFRSNPASIGVYVYAIVAQRIDGEEVLIKGEVTLVR